MYISETTADQAHYVIFETIPIYRYIYMEFLKYTKVSKVIKSKGFYICW